MLRASAQAEDLVEKYPAYRPARRSQIPSPPSTEMMQRSSPGGAVLLLFQVRYFSTSNGPTTAQESISHADGPPAPSVAPTEHAGGRLSADSDEWPLAARCAPA